MAQLFRLHTNLSTPSLLRRTPTGWPHGSPGQARHERRPGSKREQTSTGYLVARFSCLLSGRNFTRPVALSGHLLSSIFHLLSSPHTSPLHRFYDEPQRGGLMLAQGEGGTTEPWVTAEKNRSTGSSRRSVLRLLPGRNFTRPVALSGHLLSSIFHLLSSPHTSPRHRFYDEPQRGGLMLAQGEGGTTEPWVASRRTHRPVWHLVRDCIVRSGRNEDVLTFGKTTLPGVSRGLEIHATDTVCKTMLPMHRPAHLVARFSRLFSGRNFTRRVALSGHLPSSIFPLPPSRSPRNP